MKATKTGSKPGLVLSEFMLRENERQALKAVADREHVSMAEVLRQILDAHFGFLDTRL